VGTPLASFAKILATSDKPEVLQRILRGGIGERPVSAVSPAILVSEIEIEKKAKSQDRRRWLPEPTSMESKGARSEAAWAGWQAKAPAHKDTSTGGPKWDRRFRLSAR